MRYDLIRDSGRPAGVPEEWIIKSANKQLGIKYVDPENTRTSVRISAGNPSSDYTEQQEPYVVVQINGVFYDVNGDKILGDKPSATEEAHIPYSEFDFSKYQHHLRK